jgi:hypothetical protein
MFWRKVFLILPFFPKSVRVTFLVCGTFCVGGVFASIARGKTGLHSSGDRDGSEEPTQAYWKYVEESDVAHPPAVGTRKVYT